jgi:non-ribosomal peptide synthetase-like protein
MEAGVNSIAATRLSEWLRTSTGQELSPTLIFDHPTPRAIAAHLTQLGAVGAATSPHALSDMIQAHVVELQGGEQRVTPQRFDEEPEAPAARKTAKRLSDTQALVLSSSNANTNVWTLPCTAAAVILTPLSVALTIISVHMPIIAGLFIANSLRLPLSSTLATLLVCIAYGRLIRAATLVFLLVPLKWLLVGRLRESSALAIFRWRCGRVIHMQLVPVFEILRGTKMLNALLRLLGARVDWHAVVETTQVHDWDLVHLGRHAILEEDASVSAARLQTDCVVLEQVAINALVAIRAHVPAGCAVDSNVAANTCATPDKAVTINDAQVASRSTAADSVEVIVESPPASVDLAVEEAEATTAVLRAPHRGLLQWCVAISCVGAVECIADVASRVIGLCVFQSLQGEALPSDLMQWIVNVRTGASLAHVFITFLLLRLLLLTLSPLIYVFLFSLLRRAFVRPARDGDISTPTVASIFVEMALRSEQVALVSTVGVITNRPYLLLRALGARVSEQALLWLTMDRPELVSVQGTAWSGGLVVALTRKLTATGPRYRRIEINHASFLANGVVAMPGATIGPQAVIGNRSIASASSLTRGAWIGAPPRLLYRVPESDDVDSMQLDTGDEARPIFGWACLLVLNVCVPAAGFATLGLALERSATGLGLLALLVAPWLSLFWVSLISEYWTLQRSHDVDTVDKVGSWAQQSRDLTETQMILMSAAMETTKGTPLYNSVLRHMGARVGKNVCWLGNHVPEPDLLQIGDGTIIGPGVDVFTHNKEDAGYTYEPISIGKSCVLGERAAVMGHTKMQSDVELLPMAQGLKGSRFVTGLKYGGNPAGLMNAAPKAVPQVRTEANADMPEQPANSPSSATPLSTYLTAAANWAALMRDWFSNHPENYALIAPSTVSASVLSAGEWLENNSESYSRINAPASSSGVRAAYEWLRTWVQRRRWRRANVDGYNLADLTDVVLGDADADCL